MTLFHEPGWSQVVVLYLEIDFFNNAELMMYKDIVEGLEQRGHILNCTTAAAIVNSIRRGDDGRIYAKSDFRELGGTDGFPCCDDRLPHAGMPEGGPSMKLRRAAAMGPAS